MSVIWPTADKCLLFHATQFLSILWTTKSHIAGDFGFASMVNPNILWKSLSAFSHPLCKFGYLSCVQLHPSMILHPILILNPKTSSEHLKMRFLVLISPTMHHMTTCLLQIIDGFLLNCWFVLYFLQFQSYYLHAFSMSFPKAFTTILKRKIDSGSPCLNPMAAASNNGYEFWFISADFLYFSWFGWWSELKPTPSQKRVKKFEPFWFGLDLFSRNNFWRENKKL